MRSQLEAISDGDVSKVGGCVVAREGETYYTNGNTCNILSDKPRTIEEVIEYIRIYQDQKSKRQRKTWRL